MHKPVNTFQITQRVRILKSRTGKDDKFGKGRQIFLKSISHASKHYLCDSEVHTL